MPTTLSKEEQVAEILIAKLVELFGDDDLYTTLQPLITILIRVGVDQGSQAAETMLEGIMSDNSYASWRVAIETATPEERIKILEVTEQRAFEDRLKALANTNAWKAVGKVLIQVILAMLALL